jgi:hypothetical protein
MALIHGICVEYVHDTWLPRTKQIRVFAFDLKHMTAENGLETWIPASEDIRVFRSIYVKSVQFVGSNHESLEPK